MERFECCNHCGGEDFEESGKSGLYANATCRGCGAEYRLQLVPFDATYVVEELSPPSKPRNQWSPPNEGSSFVRRPH